MLYMFVKCDMTSLDRKVNLYFASFCQVGAYRSCASEITLFLKYHVTMLLKDLMVH